MCAEAGAVHHSPHFHAYYQGQVAIYEVDGINPLSGGLPQRQQRLVEAWAELRQAEPQDNWKRLQAGLKPVPIAPLE